MTPDQAPEAALLSVDDRAAQWDARLRAPDCSADERAAFQVWLEDALEHRQAYEDLQALHAALRGARTDPQIQSMREAALLASAQPEPRRPWPLVAGLRSAAAAAVIGFVYLGGLGLFSLTPPPEETVLADASATQPLVRPAALYAPPFFATEYGEIKTVSLEDGSTATLDTASLIRTAYEDEARTIHLMRGQASFDVEHDAERPFTVIAGDRRITAIGTIFDVKFENGEVEVLTIEGIVDVVRTRDAAGAAETEPTPVRLLAGDRYAAVEGRDAAPVVAVASVSAQSLWRDQRVLFVDTPLLEAFAELDRYIEADLVAEGLSPDGYRVNGRFNTDDPEAFAEDMALHFGLVIDRSEPGRIIIRQGA